MVRGGLLAREAAPKNTLRVSGASRQLVPMGRAQLMKVAWSGRQAC